MGLQVYADSEGVYAYSVFRSYKHIRRSQSKVIDLLVFGKAVNESLPSDFTAKGMSVPLSLCLFHGLHFLSFKPSQPSGTVSMEWEGRC